MRKHVKEKMLLDAAFFQVYLGAVLLQREHDLPTLRQISDKNG